MRGRLRSTPSGYQPHAPLNAEKLGTLRRLRADLPAILQEIQAAFDVGYRAVDRFDVASDFADVVAESGYLPKAYDHAREEHETRYADGNEKLNVGEHLFFLARWCRANYIITQTVS